MHVTAQFWRTAALVGFLAVFGSILGQPLALAAAVVICAVVLVRQWAFFSATMLVESGLEAEMNLPSTRYRQNETGVVTLRVTLDEPAPVDTTVTLRPPLVAAGPDELGVTVPAGTQRAETTAQIEWTTVGTATFDPPTVTVSSRNTLFTEQFKRGETPEVVVEPATPRNVHVGQGGESLAAAFGSHRAGEFGQGIEPATLREYLPGDDVGDIDWKATARHGEAYVREYEVESTRQTVMLFDHRSSTALGQPGETIAAYLKEVALTLLDGVEAAGDPLGLYVLNDSGLTHERPPDADTEQYRALRTVLHGLEPQETEQAQPTPVTDGSQRQTHAGTAQSKARRLRKDNSTFESRLRPFFTQRTQYVERLADKPLRTAAQRAVSTIDGRGQTLILTSDQDRTQLYETVKLVGQSSTHTTVFLAPAVLFGQHSLSELEQTYQEYLDFEEFRRELTTIDGVTAYEVGPGELVDQILAAGRR